MVIVTVTIDTEEDNWGSYVERGASTRNIAHLPELQERFERFGVRPTYLVNRPPLVDEASVRVLGELAKREDVEIGAHCHPWNTPPLVGQEADQSMMSSLPMDANQKKIREITQRVRSELGVEPTSFRAGRWGFGPSVAEALVAEGYRIDCSVSPFLDWSAIGGPDYQGAPHAPYRCYPSRPLEPNAAGPLLELPTTIGFLRGHPVRSARVRRRLEGSALDWLGIIGAFDAIGYLARRWLSPEHATGSEMVRLAQSAILYGAAYLSVTFHSCTLLPGATPFVRNQHDRTHFLHRLDEFFSFGRDSGFTFRTLSEAGDELDQYTR